MKDKKKLQLADKIIQYMEELAGDDDPLYEEEEMFEEKKKPAKPAIKVLLKSISTGMKKQKD